MRVSPVAIPGGCDGKSGMLLRGSWKTRFCPDAVESTLFLHLKK
jgi:hypothetical protein